MWTVNSAPTNPPVPIWGWWLTQVVLYNGCKTVVVVLEARCSSCHPTNNVSVNCEFIQHIMAKPLMRCIHWLHHKLRPVLEFWVINSRDIYPSFITIKWNHTMPQPFYSLFPGPPGWAGARRELLDFMVHGKINRRRHTDHPDGRHSIQTSNQCPPPPSPIFFTGWMPVLPPSVKAPKAASAFGLGRRR